MTEAADQSLVKTKKALKTYRFQGFFYLVQYLS